MSMAHFKHLVATQAELFKNSQAIICFRLSTLPSDIAFHLLLFRLQTLPVKD